MAEESIPVPSSSSSTSSPSSSDEHTTAAGAYKGWASLQEAVNVTLPAQLRTAERIRQQTLAVLGAD